MKEQTKLNDKTRPSTTPRGGTPVRVQQTQPLTHLVQLARERPEKLTAVHLTQLQSVLGNRAVNRLVNQRAAGAAQTSHHAPSLVIQPKLQVNAVGDKYEQEADAVAKEVVQKLNAPQPDAAPTHAQRQESIAQRLQRQDVPEEDELQLQRQETEDEELQLQRQALEEEEPQEMAMLQREAAPEEEELQLQRQELPEEEEIQLQRQALEAEDPAQLAMTQRQPQDFTHGGPVDSHIEAQINQSRGGGQPMEDSICLPMEQAFGADFSNVRIHTDTQAHNLNEAIQARAFTTSSDIYFKEGEYSPGSSAGQELIAHELTHTVQQQDSQNNKPSISLKPTDKKNSTEDKNHFEVFVIGSPSPKDDQAYPMQFVNAAIRHGYTSNTIWIVEETGYKARAKDDGLDESHYLNEIYTSFMGNSITWIRPDVLLVDTLKLFPNHSIKSMNVYSHGEPGSIDLRRGWSEKGMRNYGLNASNAKDLDPKKFSNEAGIRFDSCNTGTTNIEFEEGDSKELHYVTKFERPLAQLIANQLGLPVKAWTGRTSYQDVNDNKGGVRESRIFSRNRKLDFKEILSRLRGRNPILEEFIPESKVLELESIQIQGDPEFYQRAIRANQKYSVTPPIPKWPYDDNLRLLWHDQKFDDFADRVRDIQEQKLGFVGKNVDGILGPITAKKITEAKQDSTKKGSEASNYDERKPDNGKQSNQLENSNNQISIRADLGLKNRGRAFMLDWGKKHQEIAQSESLREVFEANLLLQLSEQFGRQVTKSEILQRIDQAEAEKNIEDAESMRIKLHIANQYAVITTLKVNESSRYQRTTKSTYCNIYAYDVVTALGGYLPRVWWTASALKQIQKGNNVQPKYGKTVREMGANALTDWMYKHGDAFGWRQENDISEAQAAANNGKLVILLAANKNPRKSGHVNVLVAETEQNQAERDKNGNIDKPLQSQAGATNFQVQIHQKKWWQDNHHKLGAAWIFEGTPNSPLLTPDELGYSATE